MQTAARLMETDATSAGALEKLLARDALSLWHPATQFNDLVRVPNLAVHKTRGVWIHEVGGREILDAISSWWTCLHGHCHPAIVTAIQRQVAEIDHVMFAGFTHDPAIELAEGLIQACKLGPSRVFFSDCGSAAIEIALKLCHQWHAAHGRSRRRFAALEHGYHGETLGALALCGSEIYRSGYAEIMKEDVVFLPSPDLAHHRHADLTDDRAGTQGPELARAIELLEDHKHEIAALVVEPLVQCAGQMRCHGKGYLSALINIARELKIPVIADEIAVGFGRTGRLMASDWLDERADIICLGKGLSGGVLPMAATVIPEWICDAYRGDNPRSFAHSHTFTGSALACAAGVASLRLLHDPTIQAQHAAAIEALTHAAESLARSLSGIASVKQCGTIVAFRMDPEFNRRAAPDGRLALRIRERALANGVLLRPLHDLIYWMPPLSITPAEVALLLERTVQTLEDLRS